MPDCLRFAFLRRKDIEPCGLCPPCLVADQPEMPPEEEPAPPAAMPGRRADKDDWVDWAVVNGMERTKATVESKARLIELFGGR